MPNLKTICFLISIYSFISCNNFETLPSTEIRINTDSIADRFDISFLIEDVTLLPLKEQSGSYIGEVFKVFKVGNNTIVFDRLKSKRIVVFDQNGNFVAKPAEAGRSLQDPFQINDCWVDINNELQVYDFSTKKIYKYDKEFNLKSILQSKYDRVFTALMDDENNGYVGYKGYTSYNSYRDNSNYKVALLGNDLSMIETFMPYSQKLNNAMIPNTNLPLQRINNSINVIQRYSNSIFSLKNKELSEKYKLTYSKASMADVEKKILVPNHLILNNKQPDLNLISSLFNGYYTFNGEWQETNDFIIIQSSDPEQKVFYSIYDKSKKKVLINAYNLTFENDKSIVPPFMTTSFKSNEYIAVYPGYMLKYIISEDSIFGDNITKDLEINYLISIRFK